VAAARTLGNARQLASALNALAQFDRMAGRLAAAEAAYAEALGLATAFDDPDYIAALQLNLAMVNLSAGQAGSACERVEAVMAIADAIGSRPAAIGVLDVCTGLAAALGDAALAARCHGVAEAEYQQAGMQRDAADAAFLAPYLRAARAAAEGGFDAALAAGRQAGFEALWRALPGWLAAVSRS